MIEKQKKRMKNREIRVICIGLPWHLSGFSDKILFGEFSVLYHKSPSDANIAILFEKKSLVICLIYLMRSICDLYTGKLHSGIEEVATEIWVSGGSNQCHRDHIRTLVLDFFLRKIIASSNISCVNDFLEFLGITLDRESGFTVCFFGSVKNTPTIINIFIYKCELEGNGIVAVITKCFIGQSGTE